MNKIKILSFTVGLILLMSLVACKDNSAQTNQPETTSQSLGQIYLYGEQHAVQKIMDKEVEIWCEYYDNQNMRHLFVEFPYYTAEFLNLWMESDNDDIFDLVYEDWVGTALYIPYTKEFFKKIKEKCPETVFHGTDVGHQYDTTGKRYLKYLEDNNMKNSEQYLLTQEVIEQGKYYYKNSDDVYRENKMTENFIQEFGNLSGESVMGIYGGAHTGLDAMDYNTNTVPCMANQLKETYKDIIHSEDLSPLAKDIEPIRVDTIEVNSKKYDASYFGKQDLTGFKDYACREFWRLEDSYNDFKFKPKKPNVLPYDNYPMLLKTGQVFVIDYTLTDGSVERTYFRSDGNEWEGMPTTEEFEID